MYEDLIKKLRTHNGWALNETLNEAANIIEELTIQNEALRHNIIALMWETEEKKKDVMRIKGENIMDEEVVFIKQKDIGELILNSLFSEETEKFYNNCAFTSQRMAFMQGMNYAALLCNAKLEQYSAIIHHESLKEKT